MASDLVWLLLTTLAYGLLISYCLAAVAAMVFLGIRQRWTYFAGGFVTLGFAWLVGASQELENPGRARVATIVIASVLVIGFFSARPALLVGVDGKALQNSVDRFFALSDECRPAGEDWICSRYDDSISGDIEYRLDVDWTGCWKGEALGYRSEKDFPIEDPTISGCITLKDEL